LIQQQSGKSKLPAEFDDVMAEYKRKYPNIPDVMVSADDEPHRYVDPNLEYADELEAYDKFKSHGYFTPNPASGSIYINSMAF